MIVLFTVIEYLLIKGIAKSNTGLEGSSIASPIHCVCSWCHEFNSQIQQISAIGALHKSKILDYSPTPQTLDILKCDFLCQSIKPKFCSEENIILKQLHEIKIKNRKNLNETRCT
jgi:hypothetical protein